MTRPTAAVIGSGDAGLTAAYLLQRRYDVTLFEADDRVGGHAHTHELPTADGGSVDIDTGFIVHNRRTYPNLLRLFGELDVATQESDMSMSVRCAGCDVHETDNIRRVPGLRDDRSAVRVTDENDGCFDALHDVVDILRIVFHTSQRIGNRDDAKSILS